MYEHSHIPATRRHLLYIPLPLTHSTHFPSWVAKVAATVAVRRLPLSVPKALLPPTHTHRHTLAHVKAQGQTDTHIKTTPLWRLLEPWGQWTSAWSVWAGWLDGHKVLDNPVTSGLRSPLSHCICLDSTEWNTPKSSQSSTSANSVQMVWTNRLALSCKGTPHFSGGAGGWGCMGKNKPAGTFSMWVWGWHRGQSQPLVFHVKGTQSWIRRNRGGLKWGSEESGAARRALRTASSGS